MYCAMYATLAIAALGEAQPAPLRGLSRRLEIESCAQKANYEVARTAWCGDQQEPFACFKDPANQNPIWDCHLQEGQWCTIAGTLCAWPSSPDPPPEDAFPIFEGATRFLTWNLYVFTLAQRTVLVANEILRISPEIGAFPEMWGEKFAILDHMRQVSGPVWAFAEGGPTEQYNDADILYRSDRWDHLESNVVPYSAGRGLSWAALRRKSDGFQILAAGTHPLCCQGDLVVLEAVEFVIRTLQQVQQKYPFPIALMGDLNTGYHQPSQQLLRLGYADGFSRSWEVALTFIDAWAELHPENPDPSTINDDPVRLDYVYFEKAPQPLGQVLASQVWPRTAGSDHRAVSGDVILAA